MIVFVESNFVLELAFRQEQASAAEGMVSLAEARKVQLVIPASALFEPYETLVRRRKERDVTQARLLTELKQLSRSKEFPDLMETSRSVTRALAESGEIEAAGLDRTIRRLLDASAVLPLSAQIVRNALDAQGRLELEPQDAVVFASVDQHLRQLGKGTKLFCNRNSADFSKPEVEAHFAQYDCKVLPVFSDALRFIENTLPTERA